MVESTAEVLVKEERRPEIIPAAIPLSNLPLVAACSLFVSLFSISASVRRKNEYPKAYIDGFRSKQREWWCNRWHPRFEAQYQWYHVVGLVGPDILACCAPWGLLYLVRCV
jgi:hypothetical protein